MIRIRIDRENKWSPCIWIGDRAFCFGLSTAATDRWPLFFHTFGMDDSQWEFLFPPNRKDQPPEPQIAHSWMDMVARLVTRDLEGRRMSEDKQTDAVYAATQAAYDQGYRDGENSAMASVIAVLQDADDPIAELRQITYLGPEEAKA